MVRFLLVLLIAVCTICVSRAEEDMERNRSIDGLYARISEKIYPPIGEECRRSLRRLLAYVDMSEKDPSRKTIVRSMVDGLKATLECVDRHFFIYADEEEEFECVGNINDLHKLPYTIWELANGTLILRVDDFMWYEPGCSNWIPIVKAIVDQMVKEVKSKKHDLLVLDLSGNAGGYVKVISAFLDGTFSDRQGATLMKTKSRTGEHPYTTTSKGALACPDIVSMNKGTASAAEIVIGYLKYVCSESVLYGSHTYGKGKSTESLEFKGLYIQYSVEEIFTPSADGTYHSLEMVGIAPNLDVDLLPLEFSSSQAFSMARERKRRRETKMLVQRDLTQQQ